KLGASRMRVKLSSGSEIVVVSGYSWHNVCASRQEGEGKCAATVLMKVLGVDRVDRNAAQLSIEETVVRARAEFAIGCKFKSRRACPEHGARATPPAPLPAATILSRV